MRLLQAVGHEPVLEAGDVQLLAEDAAAGLVALFHQDADRAVPGVDEQVPEGRLSRARHTNHRIDTAAEQLRRILRAIADELQVAAGGNHQRLFERVVPLGQVDDRALALERHRAVDGGLDGHCVRPRRDLDYRPVTARDKGRGGNLHIRDRCGRHRFVVEFGEAPLHVEGLLRRPRVADGDQVGLAGRRIIDHERAQTSHPKDVVE